MLLMTNKHNPTLASATVQGRMSNTDVEYVCVRHAWGRQPKNYKEEKAVQAKQVETNNGNIYKYWGKKSDSLSPQLLHIL